MPTDAAAGRPLSDTGPGLFDQAHAAFSSACRTFGAFESRYTIAGQAVTLRFAGRALVPALTPAFEHLRTADGPASSSPLTICVWDGSSTGIAPPPPVWGATHYLANSEMRSQSDDSVQAAFDSYLGALSMYNPEQRMALFWLRDSIHVPITLVGTPFRIVLQWWAARLDALMIHAAALGSARGGVLIAGASGAGKSTTALIGLESGLHYAGDDFVLVRPSPAPHVFSLYGSAKLDSPTLRSRFPNLQAAVQTRPRRPEEKEVLFLHQRCRERMAVDFPLRALLLPLRTAGTSSRLVPVRAADALRTLLPGLLPFPGQRQDAVGRLGRLVRALPAFRLELGTDSAGVARALRTAVDAASRES